MNDLVSAARSCLMIKFRHRGRTERGLDCAGLVWRSYHLCGVDLPDFRLYSMEPSAHGPKLTDYVKTALGDPIPVKDLSPGDVVVLRFEREPHHMGLIGDYPYGGLSLIHACGHNNRVIEHRLAPEQLARITHAFRRPV